MTNINRTNNELMEFLSEQIHFLKESCVSYDKGMTGEAKRLAVVIRVLLHDTSHSISLLNQLDSKNILFFDTSIPFNTENLLSHQGLTMIINGPDGAEYIPRCLAPPRPELSPQKQLEFEKWWKGTVLIDKERNEFSRKDLVLNLCDKEGGAHVDPKLDPRFAKLTRDHSMGWVYVTTEKKEPIEPIELASIRQIAHEILLSLEKDFPALFKE